MNSFPRFALLGGPGRSGTSAIFAALLGSQRIIGIRNVEAKIFSEIDGIPYLNEYLCARYTPNNSNIFMSRLSRSLDQLCEAASHADKASQIYANVIYRRLKEHFFPLISVNGQFIRQDPDVLAKLLRQEMAGIYRECAKYHMGSDYGQLPGPIFLEKTPHVLLHCSLLNNILFKPLLLHVIRDPRLTALSLSKMSWGPKDIKASIEFVRQYYLGYYQASLGLDSVLYQFRIEDLSSCRDERFRLLDVLGLSEDYDRIFVDITPEKHGSIDIIDKETADMLTSELGEIADSLGY